MLKPGMLENDTEGRGFKMLHDTEFHTMFSESAPQNESFKLVPYPLST